MTERKGKNTVICLSSSSEEDEDDVEVNEDDDDYEDQEDDDDEQVEDDDDELVEEDDNGDDDESLCNKVILFLQENCELESLSLKECKAYLRKHGLRVTGIKSVCVQRIKEHWRLKDGRGEALYPRASFSINCTGDVCQGDVVLFAQKVYEKFDKVTRHGRVLGKRIVAGRVIKESYGAAKQQHTFTVEVLWSRGIKMLPPVFPLLVKGRNLYKLKTHRQPWNNEAERTRVLAEKHKRGAAARFERGMKKRKKSTADRGMKHQKKNYSERQSEMRKKTDSIKGRDSLDGHRKTAFKGSTIHYYPQHCEVPPPKQMNQQQYPIARRSEGFRMHQNLACSNITRLSSPQSWTGPVHIHHQSQANSHYRSVPYPFSRHDRGSTSASRRSPLRTYADDTFVTYPPQFQCFDRINHTNNVYRNPSYNSGARNWNGFSDQNVGRPLHPLVSRTETYGQRM